MTFSWPWMLLSMPLVAAAAVWVLLRPHRMHVTVGSIRLWKEAAASLASGGRSRRRRIILSWLLILIGSLLAAVALARPVRHTTQRMRRIALIVSPTAEFAGDGGMALFGAVDGLLGRLGPGDRVRLVFPSVAGGPTDWLRPSHAAVAVRDIGLLPGRFEEVTIPTSGEADQTLAVIPAGRGDGAISADAVIEAPTSLPPVTIARLAAHVGADGQVQTFASLRNHASNPQTAELTWTIDGSPEGQPQTIVIPADATAGVVHRSPLMRSIGVRISSPGGLADLTGGVVSYRAVQRIRVATVGRNSPAVQRYIQADEEIELVADRKQADTVIAVGAFVDTDEAAVLIDPPPDGAYVTDGELSDVLLREAAVVGDSAILNGVDLADVGVRHINLLKADGSVSLVTIDSQPVLFAERAVSMGTPTQNRVVVPFDISPANTNWALSPSFAVFMANAVRWTADRVETGSRFETVAPLQLGAAPSLEAVDLIGGDVAWGGAFARLGVYRREDGDHVAVSLLGLRGGKPSRSVAEQVDAIELCEPSFADVGLDLWPAAVVAALACWLTGWFVAAGKD